MEENEGENNIQKPQVSFSKIKTIILKAYVMVKPLKPSYEKWAPCFDYPETKSTEEEKKCSSVTPKKTCSYNLIKFQTEKEYLGRDGKLDLYKNK